MARKLISLNNETLEKLKEVAKPFETPSKCITRLLDELEHKKELSSTNCAAAPINSEENSGN